MGLSIDRAVALLVFALTYFLISGRRLALLPIGRPSGALTGAVLMILTGVLSPHQAYQDDILSHDTLILLLGMMILAGYLEEGGFFGWAASVMDRLAATPTRLLLCTALVAGGLSAVLVNDPVCVLMTPLVVRVVKQRGLRLLPFLLALGCGSNVGSALTLVGNPQNMLIATYSRIPFLEFTAWMALPVAAAMACMLALLFTLFRADLSASAPRAPEPPPPPSRPDNREVLPMAPGLIGLGIALAGFLTNHSLAWSALTGATLTILLYRVDPHRVFARVDFPLLVFFGALFIVMGALTKVGLTEDAYRALQPLLDAGGTTGAWHLTWISVVGSQLFSNVPLVQALGPHLSGSPGAQTSFMVLALSSTLAGNLTTIGSVANVIVLEYARKVGKDVGFWQWLKYGVPITVLTTLLAVGLLLLELHLFA